MPHEGLAKRKLSFKEVVLPVYIVGVIFLMFALSRPSPPTQNQEARAEKKEAMAKATEAGEIVPLSREIKWTTVEGKPTSEQLGVPTFDAAQKAVVEIVFTDGSTQTLSWQEFIQLVRPDKPLGKVILYSSPKKKEVIKRIEIGLVSPLPSVSVAAKPAEGQVRLKANWLGKVTGWLKKHWPWLVGGYGVVCLIAGGIELFRFFRRRRKKLYTSPVRSP